MGRLDRAVRPPDESARMAERLVIGSVEEMHRVAGSIEGAYEALVETVLEREIDARFAPGASEQEARCIHGLGEALAEMHVAREQLRLELRLAVAAHRPVGHDAPIAEQGERRVQRVERPSAGFERVQRLRVEREDEAAILQEEPGARQDASRAELPIGA